MFLAFLLVTVFLSFTAVPVAGDDLHLRLPKRASLQQVLAFLKELNKMMVYNQPSYRLHKRGLVTRELGEGNLMDERYRQRLSMDSQSGRSNYFPTISKFGPAYYVLGGLTDHVGKYYFYL